jgi:biopolymer transport protein ExbD
LHTVKEIYNQNDSKIHLAADEKLDWQAAMNVLKQAPGSRRRLFPPG